MSWFAIYTRPKNEKKVAFSLEKMGIEAYCPMITQVKQWSDRKKKVETPLINSYVFVNINEKDRNLVFEVPGVVRYLFWLGKPAIVKNSEIETMQEWLQGEISDSRVQELKTGDTYIIQNNAFNGQEGIINEVSKNRVQIVLKELGMKITLTKEKPVRTILL